jgi:DNA-binding CsgD family transcriptional regulator
MQAKSVEDLISTLQAAPDVSTAWNSAALFFECFGLDRIIYMNVGPLKTRVMTTMPDSWMAHYIESNHVQIDPFMRHCAATQTPVGTGIDYLGDYAYLEASERKFICEASETGFRAGVSCMIRAKSAAGTVGWNLGSSLSRRELESILSEHGHLLRLAAHFSHEKLARLETDAGGNPPALSPRETECLQWIAAGLRTKEIADRMGIRPVTVELHMRNARTKLGADTREQAIAHAIAGGFVSL